MTVMMVFVVAVMVMVVEVMAMVVKTMVVMASMDGKNSPSHSENDESDCAENAQRPQSGSRRPALTG